MILLLCLLPAIHPRGFLYVCVTGEGEQCPGMAQIQLCQSGLVHNGVHQFLPLAKIPVLTLTH